MRHMLTRGRWIPRTRTALPPAFLATVLLALVMGAPAAGAKTVTMHPLLTVAFTLMR